MVDNELVLPAVENENSVRGTEDHLSVTPTLIDCLPLVVCARNGGGYPEDVRVENLN